MGRDIYLALGDSITAGDGSSHPRLSFVGHVTEYVQKASVAQRTIVVARNGWTTRDIDEAARAVEASVWIRTNLLTLVCGGNDLRRLLRKQLFKFKHAGITKTDVTQSLLTFENHLNTLCAFIASKRIPHVILGTLYNPVPNYSLAVEAIAGLNAIIRKMARRYKFQTVDIHRAFQENEPYLVEGYRMGRLEDILPPIRRPIHPNNAGHKKIAEAFVSHIAKSMQPKQPQGRRKRKTGPVPRSRNQVGRRRAR